jgi:hypothetical protein
VTTLQPNSILHSLQFTAQCTEPSVCSLFTSAPVTNYNDVCSPSSGLLNCPLHLNSSLSTVHCTMHGALGLLSLHQCSGNELQRRMFPFLWAPEVSPCLRHSNFCLSGNSTGSEHRYSSPTFHYYDYLLSEICHLAIQSSNLFQ